MCGGGSQPCLCCGKLRGQVTWCSGASWVVTQICRSKHPILEWIIVVYMADMRLLAVFVNENLDKGITSLPQAPVHPFSEPFTTRFLPSVRDNLLCLPESDMEIK